MERFVTAVESLAGVPRRGSKPPRLRVEELEDAARELDVPLDEPELGSVMPRGAVVRTKAAPVKPPQQQVANVPVSLITAEEAPVGVRGLGIATDQDPVDVDPDPGPDGVVVGPRITRVISTPTNGGREEGPRVPVVRAEDAPRRRGRKPKAKPPEPAPEIKLFKQEGQAGEAGAPEANPGAQPEGQPGGGA